MKFTLKEYQEEAVADVLDKLKKSRKRWHEDKEMNEDEAQNNGHPGVQAGRCRSE